MSEKSKFIRYVLTGALTLTGLFLSAVSADAVGAQAPERLGAAGPAPFRAPHPADSDSPATFTGMAFDTCQAPDLATMDAWREHSDYGAAGIYFGGRARACTSQVHLNPDWVRRTTASGWRLLPIYVGSQSPCVSGSKKNPYRIDTRNPAAQGADEGRDAVNSAQDLGLDAGSALYLDMESYSVDDTACADATLSYVQAWDRSVQGAGYISGFYSSADSGIRHMATARDAGETDLPEVLWYARWNVAPTLTGEPALDPATWTPHARIHQFHGAVTESHGGKKLSIDRDLVDAPVAVVG